MAYLLNVRAVLLIWVLFWATGAAIAQPNSYSLLAEAPVGEYALDKTHAYVTFSYLHQGYSRPWLRFREIDAALTLNPNDPGKSQLRVSIDAASIDSGVDEFDHHLRDAKFFDVAKYPDINFTATSISQSKKKPAELTIVGDLSMKGVTRPLSLSAVFNKGGLHFKTGQPVIGFSARAQLLRSDWNLGYAVPIVGDAVELVIEVEFHKRAASDG